LNQHMVYNYVNYNLLACHTDRIVPIFIVCDKTSVMYIVVYMGYIYVVIFMCGIEIHYTLTSAAVPSLPTTYRTKT